MARELPVNYTGRIAGSLRWAARLAGRRGAERGQAFVEFALILGITSVLLFGVVDFGRAYTCWVAATNGAREGARIAIGGANQSTSQNRAISAAGSCFGVSPTATSSNVGGGSGTDVTMTVSYSLPFATPVNSLVKLLPGAPNWGSNMTISATAHMRIE
ncbi:MAG TPA: TadE/TadG family type IV pilus assembly protein [Dehalococcoidia bacterium]|nr:TadE/TadG family type IV pilus assembly protein [Dehalococcoidia bacterium]